MHKTKSSAMISRGRITIETARGKYLGYYSLSKRGKITIQFPERIPYGKGQARSISQTVGIDKTKEEVAKLVATEIDRVNGDKEKDDEQ